MSITSPDILSAALGWAALGRRVFPLVPGEKQPAVPWSTAASTDETLIGEWWDPTHPMRYGLGLPTGDGLIVVDVDVRKGGEIPEWAPATFTVYTRSGGWHLYYFVDGEVRNSVERLGEGVDVRGDGGYVVAAPTPGWKVAADIEVAELDPLLLTAVQRRTGTFSREPFTFPEPGSIGEGERNDWMLRACGHVREQGVDDEETLMTWALDANQTFCDPPMDEPEVRRIVQNSLRYVGSA